MIKPIHLIQVTLPRLEPHLSINLISINGDNDLVFLCRFHHPISNTKFYSINEILNGENEFSGYYNV